MGTLLASRPEDGSLSCPVGLASQDAALRAEQASIEELLLMDSFLPVSWVANRLPFSMKELTQWSKAGPFASCFERVQVETEGKALCLRVNLARFSQRFDALARQSHEEDSSRGEVLDPAMDDFSSLHDFADLALRTRIL